MVHGFSVVGTSALSGRTRRYQRLGVHPRAAHCRRRCVIEVHVIAAQFTIAVASQVWPASPSLRSMHIEHVAVIVDDYDRAIEFFVEVLGFELVDDMPSLTNDGRPKRWVVVRPPGAQTGVLLARADGEDQRVAVGDQFAGRVGLFLRVDDFETAYTRMVDRGVVFVRAPRDESYGRVAVFVDMSGNKWDLLGPS